MAYHGPRTLPLLTSKLKTVKETSMLPPHAIHMNSMLSSCRMSSTVDCRKSLRKFCRLEVVSLAEVVQRLTLVAPVGLSSPHGDGGGLPLQTKGFSFGESLEEGVR